MMRKLCLWLLLVFSSLALAGDPYCDFQLNANAVDASGGSVQVYGEALGSGFDSDTYIEVYCNTLDALPGPKVSKVRGSSSAFTASFIPYKAYCDFPAVAMDTSFQVSATVFPAGTPCKGVGSSYVFVKGSGGSAVEIVPSGSSATVGSAPSSSGGGASAPVSSGGRIGSVGSPEIVSGDNAVRGALPAVPASACGNLGQIPCEKKYCEQKWALCNGYVCNAPYVNNGVWPVEKARCVACRAGTKYDGGYCVIDYSKPQPAPSVAPSILPKPSIQPTAIPPVATPVSITVTPVYTPQPISLPPAFDANELKPFTFHFKKGWNFMALPWTYGGASFSCTDPAHQSQLKFFSFSKASKSYETVYSLSALNLRGAGIVVKSSGDCTYALGQPELNNVQTLSLWKGWNLVSVQTNSFSDPAYAINVKNDCTIIGGPWRFDNAKRKYVKDSQLKPGYAYWINVKNPFCDLSVIDESAPPELPDGEQGGQGAQPQEKSAVGAESGSGRSAIEPAGTRGRRFIEDAG